MSATHRDKASGFPHSTHEKPRISGEGLYLEQLCTGGFDIQSWSFYSNVAVFFITQYGRFH